MSIIQVENLSKHFQELKAVKKVNFNVEEGELYGLLGPNGSGKTTIVKILTGQLKPTSGEARVLGVNVLEEPVKAREKVGIIPEQETPPSFLTAEEYLEFVSKVRDLEDYEERIDYWFNLLEFDNERQVLCKDLSRGTRQKLMFSQAFLHEPKLAFIDEPLINLDPVIQDKVKDYLKEFVEDDGTIFICTHILEIAEEVCTRVGILNKGELVYEGSVKDDLNELFLEKVKK